jgi:transcriptional coactivator HFI1/ADA1
VFLPGRLNQTEYTERIDPILGAPNGEKEHLHNQLIAAIYGNVTREMPDQGLAPWVSANDKPSTSTGSKPASGDASERRLKGEVMQLPARDRRRIKDLVANDVRILLSLCSLHVADRSTTFSTIPTKAWQAHLPSHIDEPPRPPKSPPARILLAPRAALTA